MGKSAEPAKLDRGPRKLELPVPADLSVKATPGNKQLALEISWQNLPKLMSRPDFLKVRSADRCFVEFDLYNPPRVRQKYIAELLDSIL
jgi:hypothetical protein